MDLKTNEILELIRRCVEDEEFEGCKYTKLDSLWYVVGTRDDSDGIKLKIAYNCDDLQCDYDIDWMMPTYKGEMADTEIEIINEDDQSNLIKYAENLTQKYWIIAKSSDQEDWK